MIDIIKLTLNDNRIYDFGVLSFTQIPNLIDCRAKQNIPPNAKSVIVCLFPYYTCEIENQNLCRYACLPDYHNVIKPILSTVCDSLSKKFPGEQFASFVDSSPIPEVEAGVKSGLGFRGKHNLLINEKYGTYFFIGEIITTLSLPPSKPNPSQCLGCNKCISACPNNAITSTGIDYTKCISYITQKKGELTLEEKLAIKRVGYAWGCDNCQSCCPHNDSPVLTHLSEFLNDIQPILTHENFDQLFKTRSFSFRGKSTIQRNLEII